MGGKLFSEMKITESKGFAFTKDEQKDTVGNVYEGDNIALLSMSYNYSGYAVFYTGSEYQYLSGVVTPADSSNVLRSGKVKVWSKQNDGEWYLVHETETIDRTMAPFELEADISGADWVKIQYVHTDSNDYWSSDKEKEASVIMTDFMLSNTKRDNFALKSPDYGTQPQLSDLKISQSNAYEFITTKVTDTVGNQYSGKNVANLRMSYNYSGYASYYVGGKYNYISGVLTPNDTSDVLRTGKVKVWLKQNGGEWYLAYETGNINRTTAPFELEVDISDADWIQIQYAHTDSNDYWSSDKEKEASVIMTDFVLTNTKRDNFALKSPDYGTQPQLSDLKISQSNAYEFITTKVTDTVGNQYSGKNVANLRMSYNYNGYASYYVGGKYNYISGVLTPNDTSDVLRSGKVKVWSKQNGGEWYLVQETGIINRTTAPFELEVDISGADWIQIQYVHTDSNDYWSSDKEKEASVIMTDFMLSNIKREDFAFKSPDYGEQPQLSELKITQSNAFKFITTKVTDTVGNQYSGKNVAVLTMSYNYNGYASYYVGGKYNHISGVLAANDTSNELRTGKVQIWSKQNGGEWYLVQETGTIDRMTAPFELEVDISGADWIQIKYVHTDSNDYWSSDKEKEASVIMTDFVLSNK